MNAVWTDDEEGILRTLNDTCFELSQHHIHKYNQLEKNIKYFKIPVIILSGINSVIAVGTSQYLDQSIISAINCILALACGIIGSIELFLKIEANMTTELQCGRAFYLLHLELSKMMALDRNHRDCSGLTFLQNKHNEFIQIISSSQTLTAYTERFVVSDYTPKSKQEILENYLQKSSPPVSKQNSPIQIVLPSIQQSTPSKNSHESHGVELSKFEEKANEFCI